MQTYARIKKPDQFGITRRTFNKTTAFTAAAYAVISNGKGLAQANGESNATTYKEVYTYKIFFDEQPTEIMLEDNLYEQNIANCKLKAEVIDGPDREKIHTGGSTDDIPEDKLLNEGSFNTKGKLELLDEEGNVISEISITPSEGQTIRLSNSSDTIIWKEGENKEDRMSIQLNRTKSIEELSDQKKLNADEISVTGDIDSQSWKATYENTTTQQLLFDWNFRIAEKLEKWKKVGNGSWQKTSSNEKWKAYTGPTPGQ